jgi:hypothetical protein
VRTITGVATSITAFVGRTLRGPVNKSIRIQSFSDYARVFGGLWNDSTVSFAVNDFFRNGGTDAIIVRLENNGDAATPKASLIHSTFVCHHLKYIKFFGDILPPELPK